MEDQKLKEFFKFDEADLQMNRNGQFSQGQVEYLNQANREFGRGMRRTSIPFLLAAAAGIVVAILGRSIGWGWILGWGVGWTLLWGLIGWGFIEGSFSKRVLRLGQTKGRIKIALKEGAFDVKRHQSINWSDLVVGTKRFEVQTDLSQFITRGDEYIVYYEKGSNTIVSLEFVAAAGKLSPDPVRLRSVDMDTEAKKLQRHFNFTEADLMANQNGSLSERQTKISAQEEKGSRRIGVFIGAIMLLVVAFLIPSFINSMRTLLNMLQGDMLAAKFFWIFMQTVFGLFILALGGAGIFLIVSQFIGKADYKLKSVRGRANLIKGYSDRRSHAYYDLNIGGIQFDGDGTMQKAIIQDAEYIVYYLESVYRIMSVELVSVE
jgi:hypothetical protein